MIDTVWYCMSYKAHLPYLVVSLRTLLDHWKGPIAVYAWPESHSIVSQIAAGLHGRILPVLREPGYRGKNDQFLDKIRIAQQLPTDSYNLYLDADTTIQGNLSPLFSDARETGFCATQFNDWTTDSKLMHDRIKSLHAYSGIPKEAVDAVLNRDWPSVNGGVWVSRPNSPILPLWEKWTWEATHTNPTFIADEKVLHLLQAKYYPEQLSIKRAMGRYNSSPSHKCSSLQDQDVVIWHYHGDSNVRQDKSPKGWELWWPIYHECLRNNFGNVQAWNRECELENKFMRQLTSMTDQYQTESYSDLYAQ